MILPKLVHGLAASALSHHIFILLPDKLILPQSSGVGSSLNSHAESIWVREVMITL